MLQFSKVRKIRVGTYGIMRNTSRLQHLKRSQRNQAPGHQLLLAVAQEEKDNVRNLEIIRISSREQIRSSVPLSGFPDVMQILTGNPDMGLIFDQEILIWDPFLTCLFVQHFSM